MKVYIKVFEILLICFTGHLWCCPNNWVAFESQCYYFSKEALPWFAAEQFCRARQSTLGTIDDGDKVFVVGLVLHAELVYHNKAFWIAANDLAHEGEWRWLTNSQSISLDSPFWFTNQPQGGDSENCLAMNPCFDTACYHDYDCGRTDLHFICEKGNSTQPTEGMTIIG